MKRKEKLISVLNTILIGKLTSINQLMAHSEMCENLGYSKLQADIQKLASDQMLLVESLIERISFLDGSGTLSELSSVMIAKTVSDLMDKNNNKDALLIHNNAMDLAQEAGDHTTADLLSQILKMEETHTDWTAIQRDQIAQKGLDMYLITQTESILN